MAWIAAASEACGLFVALSILAEGRLPHCALACLCLRCIPCFMCMAKVLWYLDRVFTSGSGCSIQGEWKQYLPRRVNPQTGKKYTVDQQWNFDTILCLRDMVSPSDQAWCQKKVVLIYDDHILANSSPFLSQASNGTLTLQTSLLPIFGRFQVWRNFQMVNVSKLRSNFE